MGHAQQHQQQHQQQHEQRQPQQQYEHEQKRPQQQQRQQHEQNGPGKRTDRHKEKQSPLFSRFKEYMGDRQPLIYLAFLLSGLSAILGLLPFVFIWQIMRGVLGGTAGFSTGQAIVNGWLALGSMALSLLLYFGALMSSHVAAFRVEVGMQKYGLARVMRMPLGYFDRMESGRIRKTISDGARSTHSFLAHQLPDLAGAVVSPILLLVALFVFDWRFGLVSLIPVILGFLIFAGMMGGTSARFQQEYFDHLDKMSAESVEYVRGIPVVKTFGQTVRAFTRFYDSIIRYRDAVYAYTISYRRHMVLFTTVSRTTVFFLIPLAILLINNGGSLPLVLADFLLYIMIAPLFSSYIMRVAYFNQNMGAARQAIDRFDQMLDHPVMKEGTLEEAPEASDLVFNDVSFRYPGATRDAVSQVSFKIEEGKTYALVGASGSGKTTTARLAARFWDVTGGEVRIGGVDIRDYKRATLMGKIAFVFQNSRLLKTTIRENICFGMKGHSDEAILEAVHLAGADDIIARLPRGLDTVYGQKGTWLSGGEQQRIALARAFLKNAPVVLLDEATAFADPENELMIRRSLKRLSEGRTCLMIAHRLSTVRDVDCILVMEDGQIVERGTHQELMGMKGVYEGLYREYERSISWTIGAENREVRS